MRKTSNISVKLMTLKMWWTRQTGFKRYHDIQITQFCPKIYSSQNNQHLIFALLILIAMVKMIT